MTAALYHLNSPSKVHSKSLTIPGRLVGLVTKAAKIYKPEEAG